jgi:nitrite reductase/ring-hydroxylating ferredoxin subunit
MDHEQQVALMRRAFAHIDAGTTDLAESVFFNPVAAYCSPQRLARESALLFREYPLLMGLSNQIPEPGDHFTDDHTGVPILVVRGNDGRARAFQNVCRHRGARVAEGCGRQKNFVCPYHGWTYGLEGQLRGIPDQRNFPGVEPEAHGLVPLPMAERHGMLWVRPSVGPDGMELDAQRHLGELDAEFVLRIGSVPPLRNARDPPPDELEAGHRHLPRELPLQRAAPQFGGAAVLPEPVPVQALRLALA